MGVFYSQILFSVPYSLSIRSPSITNNTVKVRKVIMIELGDGGFMPLAAIRFALIAMIPPTQSAERKPLIVQ